MQIKTLKSSVFALCVIVVGIWSFAAEALPKGDKSDSDPAAKKGGPLARVPATRPADASPVFANPANARSVVFVMDASGSMTNKFGPLRSQLGKAISSLKTLQKFDVIFFQDGKHTSFSGDKRHAEGMVIASADAKKQAKEYLDDVTVTSTSDPIPGLKAAFARKPDLIYLLTDGDFPDNDAVLKLVRQLNKPVNGKPVKINTIAFVGKQDTEVEFKKLLETIAKESGGEFRTVDAEKLPD